MAYIVDKPKALELHDQRLIDLSVARRDAFDRAFNTVKSISQDPFAQEDIDATERLDVTHFVGNQQKFHAPDITPQPKLDANKVAVRPEEPTKIAEQNAAVKTEYMEANRQICEQMLEAIDNVPNGGKELGSAIRNAMPQPGGAGTMLQMGAAAMDNALGLGMAGDIYAMINTIYSQNKNKNGIMGEEAGKILDTAFHNLHETNKQQAEAYRKSPATTKPPLDLSSLKSPQQMLDFLLRDPEQDPVMQKVLANEEEIENIWDNIKTYDEVYAQGGGKMTVEKLSAAVEANDTVLVSKMVGGDQEKIDLAETGKVKAVVEKAPVVAESAFEVRMNTDLTGLSGVKTNKANTAPIDVAAKEIWESLFDNEPDPSKLAPRNNNNFTAALA